MTEQAIYRSASQTLRQTKEDKLHECPTGLVTREAPYVWQALNYAFELENGAASLQDQTLWMQRAYTVIASETERHQRRERASIGVKRDSEFGLQVRRGIR